MPDLAEQLRAVVEASATPLRPADVMVERVTASRRRGGLVAVAIAAAVAVIGAGAGALAARANARHATTVISGLLGTPGWHQLSPGPLSPRQGALMAWTGSRLVAWGGDLLADGAAFDPSTGGWAPMARSPLVAGTGHVGVWDGKELLAWAEDFSGGTGAVGAGAAYDPATDRWRALAMSPLPAGTEPPVLVWDGHEVLAWAATRPDGSARPPRTVMAAFDPAADRWRSLPTGPLDVNNASAVWTGSRLLVVGWMANAPNGVFPAGGTHPAASYDPASATWHAIAAPPWDPGESGSTLAMAWTGTEAVAYTYGLRAASYDPANDRWSALPDLPLQAHECSPGIAASQGTVLATYCGQAALLYPALRTWVATDLPAVPGATGNAGTSLLDASAVAAGGRYLLWVEQTAVARHGMVAWSYLPPASLPEPAPAPAARLTRPRAMAATPGGDVLIADDGSNQVLSRHPDGTLSVVAGTGPAGFAGDGGPALAAELSQPGGMTVAPDGTVYVADTANNRVRAIAPDGVISTIAGNGAAGTATGRALAVPLGQPTAVAFHGAVLYIVDDAGVQAVTNGMVSTVVAAGPARFTVAGNLSAFFPGAIAVDATGDLFVGEASTKYVIEFSPTGRTLGTWTVYVGGAGLAAAPDGTILVADYGNFAVDRLQNGRMAPVVTFDPGTVPGLPGGLRLAGVAVGADGTIYADDDGTSAGASQPTLVKIVGGQVVPLIPTVPTPTISGRPT